MKDSEMTSKSDQIHVYMMGIDFLAKLSVLFRDDELESIADELEAEANDLPSGDVHIKGLRGLVEVVRGYKGES